MIEGHLTIDLYCNGSSVEEAVISSTRPLAVAKIFEGKTPDDAAKNLPLLFSICAVSQACAGSEAMEEALGIETCPLTKAARHCLVLVETLREHLLRIAMDWPRYTGEDVDPEQAKQFVPLLPTFKKALFEVSPFSLGARAQPNIEALEIAVEALEHSLASIVFAEPAERWLNRETVESLREWANEGKTLAARFTATLINKDWQEAGDVPVYFLPDLPPGALRQCFESEAREEFISHPEWDGLACETSALARQHDKPLIKALSGKFGSGLLTRIAARITEIADTTQKIRSLVLEIKEGTPLKHGQPTKDSGEGIGQVEAARGRLLHHVLIEKGIISRYHIVAPTEWNFHPEGVAATALRHLKSSGRQELKDMAHLLVEAIDPCVGYELRMH